MKYQEETDMIITVTMNPAIDKTIMTEKLLHGGLNRITASLTDAGGKGINVSKTIKALGGETIATGFLGRSGSQIILDCLSALGIKQDFILVDGETRVNTKVADADGTITELNEIGPQILEEQVNQLIDKLISYASEDSLFVLAGNVPRGISKDIYAEITKAVKLRGARVFMDADGELFKYGIEAVPDIVKPNDIELAQYFKCDHEADEKELIIYGKKLIEKQIKLVVISRGSKGALFITGEQVISCLSIPVKVLSTVGAGDAMVAALCYADQIGMPFLEGYKLSIATATGAVMTPGTKPACRDIVEELKKQVTLRTLE
jgi:1-phosphofructokinase